jgi:hypothetical protein
MGARKKFQLKSIEYCFKYAEIEQKAYQNRNWKKAYHFIVFFCEGLCEGFCEYGRHTFVQPVDKHNSTPEVTFERSRWN